MSELPTLADLCTQRSKKQQMHIPTNRFETESPYTTNAYTQFDLDMRRKAEILQYSNASSSNKTNDLTKKEKWTEFANNKSTLKISKKNESFYNRDINLYQIFHSIRTSDNSCPNVFIKTNSTYSDVPGNIDLYKDNSVPLYKYKSEIINYGILGERTDYNILSNYARDTFVSVSDNVNILSLYTNKPQSETTYINMSIPIALYINGTVKTGAITSGKHVNIVDNKITLNAVQLDTKYNGVSIHQFVPNIPSIDIIFDVSFNYSTDNTEFSGTYFLNNIVINDMELNTTSDFVYDIAMSTSLNTSQLLSLGGFDITVGVLANTAITSIIQENCSFTTSTPNQHSALSIDAYSNETKTNKIVVKNVQTNSLIPVTSEAITDSTPNYNRCLYNPVYFETVGDYSLNRTVYNLKNTELTSNTVANIYNVLDTLYEPNVVYNLSKGIYYFVNIHVKFPIALSGVDGSFKMTNNNQLFYDYNQEKDPSYVAKYIFDNCETVYEDTIFYYGSVKVEVTSVFDDISLCTYYDGSKRDVNVTFRYNSDC
jgi:hypothetical protein